MGTQPGAPWFAEHVLFGQLCRCCKPCLQDAAKSFAGERSERDKFAGFMEATEFDKCAPGFVLEFGKLLACRLPRAMAEVWRQADS